jgi:predicted small metal-binding protein
VRVRPPGRRREGALATRQVALKPTAVELDGDAATEVNARRQPRARGYDTAAARAMPRVINCECGQVVRGKNDEELIRNAEEHMNNDHPGLVGKISREDLLALAEEDESS